MRLHSRQVKQARWIRSACYVAAIAVLASLAACKSRTEMTAEDDAGQLGLKDYFCLVTPNECNREAYRRLWLD